jgi:ABC-type sugar transport system permease subunit
MTATVERTKRPKERRAKNNDNKNNALIGHSKALPYIFSMPAILVVTAILAFPVLYGVWESFYRPEILGAEPEWVGLLNYSDMFSDRKFNNALWRTFQFTFGSLVVGTSLGLFFSFALYNAAGKLRFLRAVTLAPYLISNVAAAVMFRILFNNEFGLVNSGLRLIGIAEPPVWFADVTWAMGVIIVAQVWTDLPLTILLLLGGLMTIDRSYMDAALVDGASAWQRARYLTIPLLAPQILISTVWLSYSTLTGLGVVLAMTGGGPLGATNTLAMEMYNVAFRNLDYHEALAIATFILVLNAVLTLVYVAVGRRNEIEV